MTVDNDYFVDSKPIRLPQRTTWNHCKEYVAAGGQRGELAISKFGSNEDPIYFHTGGSINNFVCFDSNVKSESSSAKGFEGFGGEKSNMLGIDFRDSPIELFGSSSTSTYNGNSSILVCNNDKTIKSRQVEDDSSWRYE
ncbi:hypothetical protein AYI70_g9142 [Smittium culicis]|uniref:Uncharacterized protein n=1 Tax=Smittium culicis TaxID=133412 RepID=A0A1R1XCR1_9FUNG|nr:hypothetical protein AYI70_g9142 [Smittium culicis]